jgi:hypothetical protein
VAHGTKAAPAASSRPSRARCPLLPSRRGFATVRPAAVPAPTATTASNDPHARAPDPPTDDARRVLVRFVAFPDVA